MPFGSPRHRKNGGSQRKRNDRCPNGKISDHELAAERAGGLTDDELAKVVANVVLNVLTNYLDHVADTEIDFPKIELAA